MANPATSQESASAEEAAEVMRLLEGMSTRKDRERPSGLNLGDRRNESPFGTRSPVRSMLDISGGPPSRNPSLAGIGVGGADMARSASGSRQAPVRSMLDPDNEPISTSHGPSPPMLSPNNEGRFYERGDSPAAAPRLLGERSRASDQSQFTPNSDYQFDVPSSSYGAPLPSRATTQGPRKSSRQSTLSALLSGGERLSRENDRGRNSIAGTSFVSHKQSKSPSTRFGSRSGRSQSPRQASRLNTNSYNLMADPGKFVSGKGQVIDLDKAYRRLSDAALAKSRGSLSNLPVRAGSEHVRADSGEIASPSGGFRMQKDYYPDDEDALADSSDEPTDSSDEELYGRGRARDRDSKSKVGELTDGNDSRAPKSLLAAAEEERQEISSSYKVRSLLGPDLQVTSPSGEKLTSRKAGVHPSNSFEHGTASGAITPRDTDTEEEANMDDIRRAQRLVIDTRPVLFDGNRCIRQIYRGEYENLKKEAREGLRRERLYLVATDLSDEAAHALEWTIGTVLRDGDTMLAIFAVDEESGTGLEKENQAAKGTDTPKQQSGGHSKKGSSKNSSPLPLLPTNVVAAERSQPASPDGRARSKAEMERIHALEEITDRIIRLLRKTKLQIRAVVEVIYCSTPKHKICDRIDHVQPTLVVLGSRGRSALKGVLLGSFSNYLVQKSSAPVMVARKRLRKSKYKRAANPRLANNLMSPSGEQGMNLRLSNAKID